MKIMYVITKSNWGGAQRHVFDLATAMKEKGHEVWVALGGEGLLKQKLEAAGIYTFSISSMQRDISVGKDAGSLKEIWHVIRNKRPDVLHLHSTKAAGLGSVAGRMLRVPFVVQTVHGWAFNEDRPLGQKLLIRFFSWLTMLFTHSTILLSEREFEQAARFPGVKSKLKLIHPGMKAQTLYSVDGAKQALAKKIGMEPAEFGKKTVVGTIAELHPNKGIGYLVEAAAIVKAQHPGMICIVIGDGEESASLQAMSKEKQLDSAFFLAGYMDNAAEYLKAFNVFVLPSVKEGAPYALLEAGSASLPVVATTVGGVPEIIEDMKSGILVQPKNPRELSHAISFMIEHPDERRKYGAALKERVSTKFGFDRMIWLVEGLYSTRASRMKGAVVEDGRREPGSLTAQK
ncbi:MAG: glycosyltransferase family 4 protein [Patescibacteria group bacterium]|nr:glycosyltransferase family 4 protein [Patescibacteria group bacterium]MDE1940670.1 glycosyltransferase family 4 protein [Patescibacteria group bacterium]MDE1966945.1 glycosyltransferase family 4 protein [Patescibacteria group bacterium]